VRLVQGFFRRVLGSPRLLRALLNVYPPYLGAGVRVEAIDPDFRGLRVAMPLRLYNRNYVGTHFGGSLYAMVDPFFMLMLMRSLGERYVVWDRAARVEFLKPGRGTVRAELRITEEDVAKARAGTADGRKHEPVFTVEVRDAEGDVVARVEKTLYVRLKPAHRPAPAPAA